MKMQAAVWDTYVKKKNGNVMHFDIIVPDSMKDAGTIYQYGKNYLELKNESESRLQMEECQFCHIEETTPEMQQAIKEKGYYILEMDEIPAVLPENPSRRALILHLRAHSDKYRFADFKGSTIEELQELVKD